MHFSYSYQHNLKIVRVPQTNDRETAKETAEVCIKIFKKIGVKVSLADIDIAHRVQPRNQNGRRRRGNPIICKFVRRMVRDEVLDARPLTDRLTASDCGLAPDYEMERIGIFSHLTPRLQELLKKARVHQTSFQYKFCSRTMGWLSIHRPNYICFKKERSHETLAMNMPTHCILLLGI